MAAPQKDPICTLRKADVQVANGDCEGSVEGGKKECIAKMTAWR
jgi:hypothetical protein